MRTKLKILSIVLLYILCSAMSVAFIVTAPFNPFVLTMSFVLVALTCWIFPLLIILHLKNNFPATYNYLTDESMGTWVIPPLIINIFSHATALLVLIA